MSEEVSLTEAAQRLNLSTEAVRKRILRGTLAGHRRGRNWVVVLEATGQQHDNQQPTTRPTTTGEPIDADYRAPVLDQGRRYLDELRDQWLMPLIHENGDLREELGRVKSERDALKAALAAVHASQERETSADDTGTVDEASAAQGQPQRPWWRFWERQE